jgi:hypothetical protein
MRIGVASRWAVLLAATLLPACASREPIYPTPASGPPVAGVGEDDATSVAPTPLGATASATAALAAPESAASPGPAAAAGDGSALQPTLPAPLRPTASPTTVTKRLERVVEEGALNPCTVTRLDEKFIDRAQRWLYETVCATSLWFDGLFGEDENLRAALDTNGRVELTVVHSQFDGTSVKMRGVLRTDFPNLDKRIHAFLGRSDEDEFISDRTDRLTLRSQFIDVETNEGWLAGFGYGLPGSYKQKTDFRVGGKLGSEPKIFAQARHRRNWVVDRQNLFRFRETAFWTNRDGWGSTTAFDYDHIFRRAVLFRWANVGTITEETEGFAWRTATLLYQDLVGHRAIAYELFLRGLTDAEVQIRDYGGRAIYRQSLLGRNWLVGEAVLGYSWPQEELHEPREGSILVGLGIELHFGRHLMQ